MEKIAGYCLKFRQEKCIESGIKSKKVVWGHLHEICVVDGQVNEEMINAHKNEQKKRDFKNDLTKIHVLTQKSTKLARSTKWIHKIRLGIASDYYFPECMFIKKYPGYGTDQSFLFLSQSQKSEEGCFFGWTIVAFTRDHAWMQCIWKQIFKSNTCLLT